MHMPKDKSPESQNLKKQVIAAADKAGVEKDPALTQTEDKKTEADKNKTEADKTAEGDKGQGEEDTTKNKKPEGQQAEAGADGKPKDPAEAGLESKKGALLKDIEALRLEKRELSGLPGKTEKPAPKDGEVEEPEEAEEEAEEDATIEEPGGKKPASKDVDPAVQSAIDAAVKPLQERLTAQEKKNEKEVITEVGNDIDNFPLIHKSRDVKNQNWNTLLQHLPANFATIDRTDKATIRTAIKAAYHAAFHDQIVADISARAKAQGAAEAMQAGTADVGGTGTGENKIEPINLTDEEKSVAKKMGISEEKYAARKAQRNGG